MQSSELQLSSYTIRVRESKSRSLHPFKFEAKIFFNCPLFLFLFHPLPNQYLHLDLELDRTTTRRTARSTNPSRLVPPFLSPFSSQHEPPPPLSLLSLRPKTTRSQGERWSQLQHYYWQYSLRVWRRLTSNLKREMFAIWTDDKQPLRPVRQTLELRGRPLLLHPLLQLLQSLEV